MCCYKNEFVEQELKNRADEKGNLVLWKSFCLLRRNQKTIVEGIYTRCEYSPKWNTLPWKERIVLFLFGYRLDRPIGFHFSLTKDSNARSWRPSIPITVNIRDLIVAGMSDSWGDQALVKQAVFSKFFIEQSVYDKMVLDYAEEITKPGL